MNTPKSTPEDKNNLYQKAFDIGRSNIILPFNDSGIVSLFEGVKKALGNDIVNRIERLDRNKAILVACGDNNLTKGIVDYIWYTCPPVLTEGSTGNMPRYISLRHKDYTRWTKDQIMSDLYQWRISLKEVTPFGGHKYHWDYIQFLQNVKGDQEVLENLLALTRAPNSFKLGNERMLIVSTLTPLADIPEYFNSLFEVIELEPGKQSENTGIPQYKTGLDFVPFPTPSGTQWHEVRISFIDNENVKISAREITESRHYSQMGFRDSKSSKPIFLWEFLKKLASLSGNFTNCPDGKKDEAKKYFSDLRKALRQVFRTIEGNPIPYKKTKDYAGYETAFVIEDKSHNREYEESVRKHHKKYVPPKKTDSNYKEENKDDSEDNNYNLDN